MALNYRGHVFDAMPVCTCCTTDAQAVLSDPTGTGSIRKQFRTTARIKWQQLRVLVRDMLITQDLLSLKSGGLLSVSTTAIVNGSSKVDAFQRWFDYAAEKIVLETTGGWARPYITRGYADGQAFGQSVVGAAHINLNAQAREDVISALAKVELQGIIEAVSQQAVRAVANGLLHNNTPRQLVAEIVGIIDRIGITRTNTMIELLVVKAFGEATLDVYAAVGVKEVGLIAEARQAMTTDAKKKAKPKKRASGPGSRSRGKTPSKRTIQRIAAAQKKLEGLGLVNVRTAEDDDVCPICEGIAEDGPYTIDTARSLIPAHPHCRCVFVPVKDKRFGTRKRKSL